MTEQRPEMSKEAFLNMAAQLGLEGDNERMQTLFEETKGSLARAAGVFEIDTTGYAPSPINPQFEVGA
ncbi:MAG: hypothetical protein O2826_11265 [Chloroflexi bacterium]|nr:hypothetical protein [Chloroflexota bacterium]MDA1175078.1 hypothetical protein [Chloroflexota bacterium]